MSVLILALVIAAVVLAAVAQINAKGRDLVAWAVILLGAALLIERLS